MSEREHRLRQSVESAALSLMMILIGLSIFIAVLWVCGASISVSFR